MRGPVIVLAVVAALGGWTHSYARSPKDITRPMAQDALPPELCATEHRVNDITFIVQNNGKFGATYDQYTSDYGFRDCLTNRRMYLGIEYPITSRLGFMSWADIWVGAIVDGDTLVSTGYGDYNYEEFIPADGQEGWITYRSTVDTLFSESEGAISEQDFESAYTDTVEYWYRPGSLPWLWPRPLEIKVHQKSHAWSYPFCKDFIFIEFTIENIGNQSIEDAFFGLNVSADCGLVAMGARSTLDMGGMIESYPSFQGCGFKDTLDLAWFADVSGDPFEGEFIDNIVWVGEYSYKSITDVVGFQFLKDVTYRSYTSYNWWIYWSLPNGNGSYEYGDFGPRYKANYRDFGDGYIGDPIGDRNKYYVLGNGEIDYDLVQTNTIESWDPVWIYPTPRAMANNVSTGEYFDFVLSNGPFDLPPGTEITIPMALVGGEKFHTDPTNYERNLPFNQREFYKNLDFSDLALNAMWARWVYDNPGVDSDGDGYRGKYRVCALDSIWDGGWVVTDADTFWYEGDGVPDWRAAVPPTAPKVWINPVLGGIHIRFNGGRTETEWDPLTNIVDFEGYNVWLARDDRESSYSLVATYDLEDIDKYRWDPKVDSRGNYVLDDIPRTVDYWRCIYGRGLSPCDDKSFDPLRHDRNNPFYHPDFPESTFYFAPHHYNAPLDPINGIHKRFPDAQPPPSDIHPDSLSEEYYTEDGYLKYYEYELTIENLLVTVPYYVNVTAFDFGSPKQGLNPLETSRTEGALTTFPVTSSEQLTGEKLKAYIYPNPYRLDGDYRSHGYEGRTHDDLPDDKIRSIHFNNLPIKCWIRIYSLDGDLVRALRHETTEDDPDRYHARWDLVNRNRQMIVTGLYYWVVESDDGEVQMGKLAVIF